ncbi:hypothetical protein FA10DRAFT_286497 [Acaromyces ingoldii]|uniref:Uncharacterized protein n=1 Tax=Acaromyces ingoldii TaxID=215250 RepID=A0A316YPT4_9BASI|nr:hypothetical protein FA10DRAFT_286497 [Acaromyces ingoldii]PWN90824.1 hypothetical protein FA10DRAFT_286497 [Acaromyces ingoldii]
MVTDLALTATLDQPPCDTVSSARLLFGRKDNLPVQFEEVYQDANDRRRVLARVVRYQLPGSFNPRNAASQNEVFDHLLTQLEMALGKWPPSEAPALTFPPPMGKQRYVDILFATNGHFERGKHLAMEWSGKAVTPFVFGLPLPPSDVVVTIDQQQESPAFHTRKALLTMIRMYNGIHCLPDRSSAGQSRPQPLEAIAIWAHQRSKPSRNIPPTDTGTVVALLRFPPDPNVPTGFPHEPVANFPGWIKVLDRRYELRYKGREPSCSFCKEYRPDPALRHENDDCPRNGCHVCQSREHLAANCDRRPAQESHAVLRFLDGAPLAAEQEYDQHLPSSQVAATISTPTPLVSALGTQASMHAPPLVHVPAITPQPTSTPQLQDAAMEELLGDVLFLPGLNPPQDSQPTSQLSSQTISSQEHPPLASATLGSPPRTPLKRHHAPESPRQGSASPQRNRSLSPVRPSASGAASSSALVRPRLSDRDGPANDARKKPTLIFRPNSPQKIREMKEAARKAHEARQASRTGSPPKTHSPTRPAEEEL